MFSKRAWYELKVAFGVSSLLPLPTLAVFGLLEWFLWHNDPDPMIMSLVPRDFTLLMPLIAGMAVAHLMSVEKDEGFEELRLSYPEAMYRQSLRRTLMAFLFAAAALMLGWVAYSLVIGQMVPLDLITPCLPPTLYMMGLSLLVNHLSGSYWAAAGTVMAYWFLEVQTQVRGRLTGDLFLFNSVWNQGVDNQVNVMWLCGLAALFLLANIMIGSRGLFAIRGRSQVVHE